MVLHCVELVLGGCEVGFIIPSGVNYKGGFGLTRGAVDELVVLGALFIGFCSSSMEV